MFTVILQYKTSSQDHAVRIIQSGSWSISHDHEVSEERFQEEVILLQDYFWRFGTKEFGKDQDVAKGIPKVHTIFLQFIPGMTI